MKMVELGFTPLPSIIWRKQSNAPNKFMGSGMLPAGAYVTHEHEHILIYRKGGKRQFTSKEEKQVRRESAFFWEERNKWFSDLWDLKGTRQKLDKSAERERSAAYPFELPFRLIAMYSVKGDTVLDPFMGTGSTHAAAIALGRDSIGYEIDPTLEGTIEGTISAAVEWGKQRQQKRLDEHTAFVAEREASGKEVKHFNEHHQMKVMTSQEKGLEIDDDPDPSHQISTQDPEDRSGIAERFGTTEEEYKQTIDNVVNAFIEIQSCFVEDGTNEHKKARKFRHWDILNTANSSGTSVTERKFVDSPPEIIRKYRKVIKNFDDWVEIYYKHAKNGNGDPVTEEVLEEQADMLRRKVAKAYLGRMGLKTPEIKFECYLEFVKDLVFNRTWDGVFTGEENSKNWLRKELIEHDPQFIDPPEGYDADYDVDLIIVVNENWIGIQVKPTSKTYTKREKAQSEKKHKKFEDKYGGKVFTVWNNKDTLTPFTPKKGDPIIANEGLVEKVKSEIKRLEMLQEEEE